MGRKRKVPQGLPLKKWYDSFDESSDDEPCSQLPRLPGVTTQSILRQDLSSNPSSLAASTQSSGSETEIMVDNCNIHQLADIDLEITEEQNEGEHEDVPEPDPKNSDDQEIRDESLDQICNASPGGVPHPDQEIRDDSLDQSPGGVPHPDQEILSLIHI